MLFRLTPIKNCEVSAGQNKANAFVLYFSTTFLHFILFKLFLYKHNKGKEKDRQHHFTPWFFTLTVCIAITYSQTKSRKTHISWLLYIDSLFCNISANYIFVNMVILTFSRLPLTGWIKHLIKMIIQYRLVEKKSCNPKKKEK